MAGGSTASSGSISHETNCKATCAPNATACLIKCLNEDIRDVASAIDFAWVLIAAFLIFFMKAGFVMLEYGGCSLGPIDRRLLLRMKVVDTVVGALAFWLVGYNIIFATSTFSFGNHQFDDHEETPSEAESTALWEFHFAFAANAATVVTGAVVGRVQVVGYALGTLAITAFVHPFAAQWVWNKNGWLSSEGLSPEHPGIFGSNGFLDFAGAVVIHYLGSVAAVVCVVFAGKSKRPAEKQDEYLATLGVLILWFAWYGFTAGTTDGMTGGRFVVAAHIALTTTLSIAAAGGSMFVRQLIRQARRASSVPHLHEKSHADLHSLRKKHPRRKMIAELKILKACVKRGVRINKQAKEMVNHLEGSDDEDDQKWGHEIHKRRELLRAVWHTGNLEAIDERVTNLLEIMEEGPGAKEEDVFPAAEKPSPSTRRDMMRRRRVGNSGGKSKFISSLVLGRIPRSPLVSRSSPEPGGRSSPGAGGGDVGGGGGGGGGDAPFVEWTIADDDVVGALCGMRSRFPLGARMDIDKLEHHELHVHIVELVVLFILFVVSLPALLPLYIFLLVMAYAGPAKMKDPEVIRRQEEHQDHDHTDEADQSLVNHRMQEWLLLQRELKRRGLLSDHQEIEMDQIGIQWYPSGDDINLIEILHAMLVGLVAITACGNVIPSYMAIVIGVVCVDFYELGVVIEQIFRLHDALHAFPVHGMGGLCGALFSSLSFIHNRDDRFQHFYGHKFLGSPAVQYGVQYLGLMAVCAWVVVSMLIVYGSLWSLGLLATESAQFGKWRTEMREDGKTAWASLKRIVMHSWRKSCGRHAGEDDHAHQDGNGEEMREFPTGNDLRNAALSKSSSV